MTKKISYYTTIIILITLVFNCHRHSSKNNIKNIEIKMATMTPQIIEEAMDWNHHTPTTYAFVNKKKLKRISIPATHPDSLTLPPNHYLFSITIIYSEI